MNITPPIQIAIPVYQSTLYKDHVESFGGVLSNIELKLLLFSLGVEYFSIVSLVKIFGFIGLLS